MQSEVSFTGGLCVDGMRQMALTHAEIILLCDRKGKPVILVTDRSKWYSCFGEQEA